MSSRSAVASLVQMEQHVIGVFRQANALTPASAIVPPAWPTGTERKMFERFVRKRALMPMGDGRYYLDEARWAEYSRSRWRGLKIYFVVLLIVVIALIILLP
ncbi:MAG: hypothetical protein M3081_21920 [Gemmatimonadota bacterium]|nr:hypothetical protein [Gemmatimonadota bacterium]